MVGNFPHVCVESQPQEVADSAFDVQAFSSMARGAHRRDLPQGNHLPLSGGISCSESEICGGGSTIDTGPCSILQRKLQGMPELMAECAC